MDMKNRGQRRETWLAHGSRKKRDWWTTWLSADQLKAQQKSTSNRDDGRFIPVAMQVAAHGVQWDTTNSQKNCANMIDAAKSRLDR